MKIANPWKGVALAAAALALFASTPVWADNPLASDPAVVALGYTSTEQDYFESHDMYGYNEYASFDTNDRSLMKNRYFIRMGQNAFMTRKSDDSTESNIHPQLLNIRTGDTVSFWADGKPHTIQNYGEGNGIFPQVVSLGPGQMYSYTFLKPGTYRMDDGLNKIHCMCECMTIIVSGNALTADSFLPHPTVSVLREEVPAPIVHVEAPHVTPAAPPPPPIAAKPTPPAPRPRDRDVK